MLQQEIINLLWYGLQQMAWNWCYSPVHHRDFWLTYASSKGGSSFVWDYSDVLGFCHGRHSGQSDSAEIKLFLFRLTSVEFILFSARWFFEAHLSRTMVCVQCWLGCYWNTAGKTKSWGRSHLRDIKPGFYLLGTVDCWWQLLSH